MFVPVIIGTGRTGRKSEWAARYVMSIVSESGVDTEIVDPREHLSTPFTGRVGKEIKAPSKWQEIASRANGFIFIIPEYNRSYPGELKLLFDQLYGEYKHKPFGLIGVSDGMYGGARAVEAFAQAVRGAEGIALKGKFMFPKIDETFDKNGNLIAGDFKEQVLSILEDIKTLSKT